MLHVNPLLTPHPLGSGLPAPHPLLMRSDFDPICGQVFGHHPGWPTWMLMNPTMTPVVTVATAGAAYSIGPWQSGTLYTNEGATARQDFNLPGAATDLMYLFYCKDADGIRIIAAAGDTIRIDTSVSAAAGRIDSTTIGSAVRLQAINATEWVALAYIGTWGVT